MLSCVEEHQDELPEGEFDGAYKSNITTNNSIEKPTSFNLLVPVPFSALLTKAFLFEEYFCFYLVTMFFLCGLKSMVII